VIVELVEEEISQREAWAIAPHLGLRNQ